jgi:glycosyltransferase involved in cell wall biosynthesis
MNRKPSILFINRWVGYNQGGNESHIKDLIVWMKKMGHHVFVITTHGRALEPIRNSVDDVIFIKGKTSYFSNSFFPFIDIVLYLIRITFAYIRMRRKHQIDVLSIHFSLEGFWYRFVRLFSDIPSVFVFAGNTIPEIIEGKYSDVRVHISKTMAKASENADYSYVIIPKGIDRHRFSRSGKKLRDKRISSHDIVVLSVCRLDPRKNLATLIHAAVILLKKHLSLKFLVIGDGIEHDKLTRLIEKYQLQKSVILYGSVPQESDILPSVYRRASVFALPTLYEGFGWVFLEAMSCGVPIVSTKVGSNPEVLINRGLLVPPKNPEAFAKAVERLLIDKKLRNQLKKNGENFAASLAWPKIARIYSHVYRKASIIRLPFHQRLANFNEGSVLEIRYLTAHLAQFINHQITWHPDLTQTNTDL